MSMSRRSSFTSLTPQGRKSEWLHAIEEIQLFRMRTILLAIFHLLFIPSCRFDALTSSYYRGAGACAIVFSTTDRASFDALDKWREKLTAQVGEDIVVALVQNKIDLASEAKMTEEEVNAVATRWKVPLFRTSVKDNVNVDALFSYLASQYILKGGDTSGVTAMPAMGTLGTHGGNVAAPAASSASDGASASSPSNNGAQSPSSGSGSASSISNTNSAASPSGASASSPRGAGGGPITIRSADSASSPSSAGGARKPVEEKVIETREDDLQRTPAAPATQARAAQSGAGTAALPLPPTSSGAFKLTAEPKLKKKKKGIFSC
jgi:Ras family